jgi:hypothetical protein
MSVGMEEFTAGLRVAGAALYLLLFATVGWEAEARPVPPWSAMSLSRGVDMTRLATTGLSGVEAAFFFAWYRDTQRLELLLDAIQKSGRDIRQDRFGPGAIALTTDSTAEFWTVLHVAVIRNAPDIVRMLLERGFDVDAHSTTNFYCETPLRLLLERDRTSYDTGWPDKQAFVDMALLLVAHGARYDLPMRSAVGLGDEKLCRALLDAGADPNQRSEMGFTPLHEAAMQHNCNIVALLLSAGADATAMTLDGCGVLDAAGTNTAIRAMILKSLKDRAHPEAPRERSKKPND